MLVLGSLLFALLAFGAVACVPVADFESQRRQQSDVRAQVADTQVTLDKINRRVDTLQERIGDQAPGGGTAEIQALQDQVLGLEARVNQLQLASMGIQPLDPSRPNVGGPSVRTEAAAIAWVREEGLLQDQTVDETYRQALQLYGDGQVEQSIEQFRQFVAANPDSDLADNAQYWMGEGYYSQGDYNRSIIELNEVLLKYPRGDRVPGALLALATAFADSGDKIDARLILQKLINDHPDSEEAEAGRQQLQTLTE